MSSYGNESTNKELRNKAAKCREMATLFQALCDVVKQFDGKVYNSRFDDAVMEATGKRAYVHVKHGEHRSDGYKGIVYIGIEGFSNGESFHLVTVIRDGKNDRRINAVEVTSELRESRRYYVQRAIRIEYGIETIGEYAARLESLDAERRSLLGEIDPDVKLAYGLN